LFFVTNFKKALFVPNLFCGPIGVQNLFCGPIEVQNLFCGTIGVQNLFCGTIGVQNLFCEGKRSVPYSIGKRYIPLLLLYLRKSCRFHAKVILCSFLIPEINFLNV